MGQAVRAGALCVLAAVLGLPTHVAAQQAPNRAPNVVFIMVDDLGYGDLGTYGQAYIQTPHLDRMAREGMRFTQYYAGHTVCAPSRWALMTGRHTGHTRVRGNLFIEPRGDEPLPAEDTTLAELFDRAGYATGVYGKWALGLKETTGAPHRQGFDRFFGYEDQSEAHHYYVETLQGIQHGVTVNVDVDTTQYTHDLFVEAALRFVEDHREEPFFLYLPLTIPHADVTVPPAAIAPYLDEEGRSVFSEGRLPAGDTTLAEAIPLATYAGMVSRLDRDVGRLLDRLRALGLDEHTLVFFTSDNGPHAAGGYDPDFFDSNGPLRGIKRDLYEGGIRVPMIAWGPGRVPAGRTSDHVWAAWDVVPTLADIAGLEAPARVDGLSMREALTGAGQAPAHDYLYWEFRRPVQEDFVQAVRAGAWKALRWTTAEGQRVELYDLGADPGEEQDVADRHPEVVRRLTALMDRARSEPEIEAFRVPPGYPSAPPGDER